MAFAGIDLGTTTSEIAYISNGAPVCLEIQGGGGTAILPSVVEINTITNQPTRVGANATKKQNTTVVYDSKRFLGRRLADKDVNTIRSMNLPFPIVADENENAVYRIITENEEGKFSDLSPGTVSAAILKTLADTFRKKTGLADNAQINAVITIPANFQEPQRNATKAAAESANINVLRLVAEPTAAALAYLAPRKENVDGVYVVFDFGGGTHDVSVVRVAGKKYTVLATDGDTLLGGRDVDKLLLDLVHERLKDFGFAVTDKDANKVRQQKEKAERELRKQVTALKIDLTASTEAELACDAIYEDLDWEGKNPHFTRAELETEIQRAGLLQRVMNPVDKALKDARLSVADVKQCLVVGGSSRIPIIQESLKKKFPKAGQVDFSGNFDLFVAMGAALLAGSFQDLQTGDEMKQEGCALSVVDVIPQSLGIEVVGDKFSRIMAKNSSLPLTATQQYCTFRDNQDNVRVAVLQGEEEKASQNTLVDTYYLRDLPKLPAGEAKLDVTFSLDSGGVLEVTVVDVSKRDNFIKHKVVVNRTMAIVTENGQARLLSGQAGEAFKELTRQVYMFAYPASDEHFTLREKRKRLLKDSGLWTFIHEERVSRIKLEDVRAREQVLERVRTEFTQFNNLSVNERMQAKHRGSMIRANSSA